MKTFVRYFFQNIKFSILFFGILGTTIPSSVLAESNNNEKTAIEKEIQELEKSSPEIVKQIHIQSLKYPQRAGGIKYGKAGHKHTTFIIAKLAGFDDDIAYEWAYFSQFPDDNEWFSATVGFFYILDLKYRKQLMSTLHSLHGGKEKEVLKRREDLANMINSGIKNRTLKNYQIGLVIHSLADSYAHTELENGKLEAFGYGLGHLFHGHKPDIIAYFPEKFKAYTCHLYKALSSKDNCKDKLKNYHEKIDILSKHRNLALAQIVKFSKDNPEIRYSESSYRSMESEQKDKVKKVNVLITINSMEKKLQPQLVNLY